MSTKTDPWITFKNRLAGARRLTHALELASKDSAASESASLYENLRFFLRSGFMIPPTSSMDERAVYRDVICRLADVGDIPMTEATRILGYLVD